MSREVIEKLRARPTSDGAGVKLNRVFGGRNPELYDPFLLLDAFGSNEANDYIAGFPAHPHRGFETVTYMLQGKMLHEDHLGNRGLLNDGDVQWMTAARGIIHSEMPQQTEGRMSGFQLWVNLPSHEKMKDPFYRDIPAQDIPELSWQGVKIKAIAGDFDIHGQHLRGAVSGLSTDPLYLDVHLDANTAIELPVNDGNTAIVYVYKGNIELGNQQEALGELQAAVLSREGVVKVSAIENARFLLLAGKPLHEPVVQYGPFVMNTPQEIDQAIQDYRDGVLTH